MAQGAAGTHRKAMAVTAQVKTSKGGNGKTGFDEYARFVALPVDTRLAEARKVDPQAAAIKCSRCEIVKVRSSDPVRSEYRKNANIDSGYHRQCKACADLAPSRANRYPTKHKPVKPAAPAKVAKVAKPIAALVAVSKTIDEAGNAMWRMFDANPTGIPAPAAEAPSTSAAPDLLWVGSRVYSRSSILMIDIDEGGEIVNLVTTALEIDPKHGIARNVTYTHVDAEARALVAQLGGRHHAAGLSNQIAQLTTALQETLRGMKKATTERDEARRGRDMLFESAKAADLRANAAASELERAIADRIAVQNRLDALTNRLAAVGITITLDT